MAVPQRHTDKETAHSAAVQTDPSVRDISLRHSAAPLHNKGFESEATNEMDQSEGHGHAQTAAGDADTESVERARHDVQSGNMEQITAANEQANTTSNMSGTSKGMPSEKEKAVIAGESTTPEGASGDSALAQGASIVVVQPTEVNDERNNENNTSEDVMDSRGKQGNSSLQPSTLPYGTPRPSVESSPRMQSHEYTRAGGVAGPRQREPHSLDQSRYRSEHSAIAANDTHPYRSQYHPELQSMSQRNTQYHQEASSAWGSRASEGQTSSQRVGRHSNHVENRSYDKSLSQSNHNGSLISPAPSPKLQSTPAKNVDPIADYQRVHPKANVITADQQVTIDNTDNQLNSNANSSKELRSQDGKRQGEPTYNQRGGPQREHRGPENMSAQPSKKENSVPANIANQGKQPYYPSPAHYGQYRHGGVYVAPYNPHYRQTPPVAMNENASQSRKNSTDDHEYDYDMYTSATLNEPRYPKPPRNMVSLGAIGREQYDYPDHPYYGRHPMYAYQRDVYPRNRYYYPRQPMMAHNSEYGYPVGYNGRWHEGKPASEYSPYQQPHQSVKSSSQSASDQSGDYSRRSMDESKQEQGSSLSPQPVNSSKRVSGKRKNDEEIAERGHGYYEPRVVDEEFEFHITRGGVPTNDPYNKRMKHASGQSAGRMYSSNEQPAYGQEPRPISDANMQGRVYPHDPYYGKENHPGQYSGYKYHDYRSDSQAYEHQNGYYPSDQNGMVEEPGLNSTSVGTRINARVRNMERNRRMGQMERMDSDEEDERRHASGYQDYRNPYLQKQGEYVDDGRPGFAAPRGAMAARKNVQKNLDESKIMDGKKPMQNANRSQRSGSTSNVTGGSLSHSRKNSNVSSSSSTSTSGNNRPASGSNDSSKKTVRKYIPDNVKEEISRRIRSKELTIRQAAKLYSVSVTSAYNYAHMRAGAHGSTADIEVAGKEGSK